MALCGAVPATLPGVGLGSNPLITALWNMTAAALNNLAPFITDRIQQVVRAPLTTRVYYPTIVQFVQVSVCNYLRAVKTNVAECHEGVERLELHTLVTDIKRGTFLFSSNWVPLVPRGAPGATSPDHQHQHSMQCSERGPHRRQQRCLHWSLVHDRCHTRDSRGWTIRHRIPT